MKIIDLKELIYSDLYRYCGKRNILNLIKYLVFGESYRYIFILRICNYMYNKIYLKYSIFIIFKIILNKMRYKYGISIDLRTKIDKGFYISHFGNIVIHRRSIIGKNCNISQGVTLGKSNRGERKGYPQIGSDVYIGPGAKIIGNVKIGNNVAIGANCVVTKDIPNDSVAVGIPAKIISNNGSRGYINNRC